MSRVDINTAVSNQFLRILYSILIPGFIPTCIGIFYLGHFINENCLNLLSLGKKEFNLAILISGTLTIGFIIEIFGVWLESKYIDNHISNQSKYEDFESVWESYLKLDFELTKNIILVQY